MGASVLRKLHALRERHELELRRLVAEAVAAGARSQDIAEALGIGRSTLWRRYGDELRRTGARGEARTAGHDGRGPAGVSRRSPRS